MQKYISHKAVLHDLWHVINMHCNIEQLGARSSMEINCCQNTAFASRRTSPGNVIASRNPTANSQKKAIIMFCKRKQISNSQKKRVTRNKISCRELGANVALVPRRWLKVVTICWQWDQRSPDLLLKCCLGRIETEMALSPSFQQRPGRDGQIFLCSGSNRWDEKGEMRGQGQRRLIWTFWDPKMNAIQYDLGTATIVRNTRVSFSSAWKLSD